VVRYWQKHLVFGRNTWYLAETLGIWQKHLVFGVKLAGSKYTDNRRPSPEPIKYTTHYNIYMSRTILSYQYEQLRNNHHDQEG